MRLHLGTADVAARVVVAGGALAPGEHRPARVVLDEPIVARAGDRFVLRAESPVVTIGGGVVRDPYAPPRARPWPELGCTGAAALSRVLDEAGSAGVERVALPVRLGMSSEELTKAIRKVNAWRVQHLLLGAHARDELAARALATLASHHKSYPLEPGLSAQSLRASLHAPAVVADAMLADLAANRKIVMEQGLARLATFAPSVSADQHALRDALLTRLHAAGREPPALGELVRELNAPLEQLRPLVHHLAREGALVAVEPDRFYASAALKQLVGALANGMEPGRQYGPSELRELLGVSRKFMIPLLEFCDRAGHTVRDAEGRRSFVRPIS